MSKFNLNEFIQYEIKRNLAERSLQEKLPIGHESNLHGDERTQRQFVIDLASQHPFGLISISDIADALSTTRDAIRDNYARQIRYYADKEDFDKIISEVPFRSAAIYQLVAREKSAPLSKQQLEKIRDEEEKKYDDTTGVYYSIYSWTKGDRNPINLAFLNLREDDDVKKYKSKLPKQQDIYGDIWYYEISDKKMKRVPDDRKDKIIASDQFDAFVEKEFEEE